MTMKMGLERGLLEKIPDIAMIVVMTMSVWFRVDIADEDRKW